ncbi:ThuA domain-containing protein [Bacillus sp. FJAT-27251]|uniref:ThuA domain-containing protein n=1 Tax=Bacillus sp. FJAT-27251 TaxID=1684142 RepID=UPI0006A7DBC3|nr:ThuA domain-containing protein [Bacillus sp. FJAT-27251]
MVKIAALLGDFYHSAPDAKAGLEAAVAKLPNNENIQIKYVSHEQLSQALDEKPDLFINAKMDQLNPKEDPVHTWLTEELDQKLVNYAKEGGSILAWHAGMAGYQVESAYIKMLLGYFDYHPPGLQEVTYLLKEGEETGNNSFTIMDEQYFVVCDQSKTEVDLWSTGVHGDSLAGWQHRFGKGKVCCYTPAHTREGMLNQDVSWLLAQRLQWLLEKL